MFFIPFRVDLNFNRLPIITVLVCLLCLGIYIQQLTSIEKIRTTITGFCKNQTESSFKLAIEKIAGADTWENCAGVFWGIYQSKSRVATINEFIDRADGFDGFSDAYGKKYIREQINEKLVEFDRLKIEDLTDKLMYRPDSYNVVNMLTAAVAHGSWMHLIGNLFFFFAFATSVEAILGSVKFVVLLVVLALGTHIAYSLAMAGVEDAVPTLGLSGVVMGVIGTFAYLMPTTKIRCFLWFIWIFKVLTIPAWILAFWYIGWDVYALYHTSDSNVNYIAHVSGGVIGFMAGLLLLRNSRAAIRAELLANKNARAVTKAIQY